MTHIFSVAPMLDWTNRHCRYFHRVLTKRALLYTEMVSTGALLGGGGRDILEAPSGNPVAVQLGGSCHGELARCAKLVEQNGYSEVNLNVGCPSSVVQKARFGACLMGEVGVVADCVGAMKDAVDIPITVKHRIGIDGDYPYAKLADFVGTVAQAGCGTFIIHARKAWLQGLSPKQNRTTPPLEYETVYRIKRDFPHLKIIINGGINLQNAQTALQYVDGVMVGRQAYQQPYLLTQVDGLFYGEKTPPPSRAEVASDLLDYTRQHLAAGGNLHNITRHILGLFHGQNGAGLWRRVLGGAAGKGADERLIVQVLQQIAVL